MQTENSAGEASTEIMVLPSCDHIYPPQSLSLLNPLGLEG